MNKNSNLSSLPFFSRLEEQTSKRSYANGQNFPIIAPKDVLLPFQIVLPPYGVVLDDITVHAVSSDGSVRVRLDLPNLTLMNYEEYQVLVYPASTKIVTDFSSVLQYNGRMYIEVDNEGEIYYSELIEVVTSVKGMTAIRWKSFSDVIYKNGRIVYEGVDYTNVFYTDKEIGRPTYNFSDDGEERDGFYFPTKQVSEKSYHLSFLATEPICDALRVASLSDLVFITDKDGRLYECDTFLSTPSWQEGGLIASVECEFQTDTMVVAPCRNVAESLSSPVIFLDSDIVDKNSKTKVEAGKDYTLKVVPFVPGTTVKKAGAYLSLVKKIDGEWRVFIQNEMKLGIVKITLPNGTAIGVQLSTSL